MGDTPSSKCKKKHTKKDLMLAEMQTGKNKKLRAARHARRLATKERKLVAWGVRNGVSGLPTNMIRAAVREVRNGRR